MCSMRVIRDPLKRFLDKITKDGNGCWYWQAGKRDGYEGKGWVR